MRKADNLKQSCADVMKSGNLNFLEPSGPLQACNGTAVPFNFYPVTMISCQYTRGTDESLARPGRKQARKHVRDAREISNIETRAVIILGLRCPQKVVLIECPTLSRVALMFK